MLVENVQLISVSQGRLIASWQPLNADWLAWVYMNGQPLGEAIYFDPTATLRSVEIDWDINETHVLEIHEAPVDSPVQAIHCPLWIFPSLSWNAVVGASRYRIYWKGPGVTSERVIFDDWVGPDEYGVCHVYSPLSGPGSDKMWWKFKSSDTFTNMDLKQQYHLSFSALDGRGGKWHRFRVKAVDEYGNESTCKAWNYLAWAPENGPTVTITNGSTTGHYNLTITEQDNGGISYPNF